MNPIINMKMLRRLADEANMKMLKDAKIIVVS